MPLFRRLLKWLLILLLSGVLFGVLAIFTAYMLVRKDLPSVDQAMQVEMQVPLKVLSSDGKLIATFGETRRDPRKIAQIPAMVSNAFISAEDGSFRRHYGIDPTGIARAVWEIVTTGEKGSGGSTITQQLARGIYLTPEKTYKRKLIEIFTAVRLERALSKDQILELYLNKIFLGQRAYGVAAAAEVYYGKALDQLSIAQCAMLAALPKAPSELNPIHNPKAAVERRNYVLLRLQQEGYITPAQYQSAITEADVATLHNPPVELDAPYIAEMSRLEAEKILGGAKSLEGGYRVITSIDSKLQMAADQAVSQALQTYDRRHGWRGAEATLSAEMMASPILMDRGLEPYFTVNGLASAVVTQLTDKQITVHLNDGQDASVPFSTATWARRHLNSDSVGSSPKGFSTLMKVGDVIRVKRDDEGNWQLSQLPNVQGAFVGMDPEDGSIKALVGGYSFYRSKFNRATQSMRQPGSSFKPFIYSAALEKGFTTASIINDAPIRFENASVDKIWEPQNDNETFNGPMRLREAMVTSRNVISVRVLDSMGVKFARRYVQKFGFTAESLPNNLSIALGTSSAPPIQMARGYAVFANSGFLVTPHVISRIEDSTGKVVFEANAPKACATCPERLEVELTRQEAQRAAEAAARSAAEAAGVDQDVALEANQAAVEDAAPIKVASGMVLAPRAIDERNAYIITTMMRDVVKRGTGRQAMALGRNDLAGKTGTTNDHRDAWFSGFSAHMVGSAWVGFDDFSSLGAGEFGAKAALPIWMDFMKIALEGAPEELLTQPTGVTTARINGRNGLLTSAGDGGAIMEYFRVEDLGKLGTSVGSVSTQSQSDPIELF